MSRRPARRNARAAQRRKTAAFNLAGAGLLLVVLPHVLPTMMAAAFHPLAVIGWLLLMIGIGLIVLQRRRGTGDPESPAASPDRPRPSRTAPPG